MKKLILSVMALGLCFSASAQNQYDLVTLTNVPAATSHTATNGGTNFVSQQISPNNKALTFWIKAVGTNAGDVAVQTYSIYGTADGTTNNRATAAIATMAITKAGVSPVVKQFYFVATNFYGMETVYVGSLTNAGSYYGRTTFIKVLREKN